MYMYICWFVHSQYSLKFALLYMYIYVYTCRFTYLCICTHTYRYIYMYRYLSDSTSFIFLKWGFTSNDGTVDDPGPQFLDDS